MALGDYESQQSKLARGAKDKEHAREAQCRNRRNRHRYRQELVPHRRSRSARWILLLLNALTEYLLLVSVFENHLSTGARIVRGPGGNLVHLCFLQLKLPRYIDEHRRMPFSSGRSCGRTDRHRSRFPPQHAQVRDRRARQPAGPGPSCGLALVPASAAVPAATS